MKFFKQALYVMMDTVGDICLKTSANITVASLVCKEPTLSYLSFSSISEFNLVSLVRCSAF